MPSPIAHGAVGYIVYRAFREPLAEKDGPKPWPNSWLLAIILVLTFLPDFDVVPGLIFGDLQGFHNNITNSIFVGVIASLIVGAVMFFFRRERYRLWAGVTLILYTSHIVMDYLAAERGTLFLWPFSTQRFVTPFRLFYGLHHSEGLISVNHVWTALTELIFAAAVLISAYFLARWAAASRRNPSA